MLKYSALLGAVKSPVGKWLIPEFEILRITGREDGQIRVVVG